MTLTVDTAFGYLSKAADSQRLAHAYLIVGPKGSGKNQLAAQIVAMLNGGAVAQNLDELAAECVRIVRPESKSRRIKIEQIRDLESMFYQRAAAGVTKIGIIADADRMGEQAENAFLKTLEEPPPGCLLLLLTAFPEQLLDTILSRCIPVGLRQQDGRLGRGEAATRLQDLLASAGAGSGTSEALGMARAFSDLLKEVKAGVEKGTEMQQKRERDLYAKTTDGRWLKEREEYFKALSTASYLGERAELLEVLVAWFGDALRQQAGYHKLDLPSRANATGRLADSTGRAELERRLGAIEGLRSDLATNVQEALAIEVAFLNAFAS